MRRRVVRQDVHPQRRVDSTQAHPHRTEAVRVRRLFQTIRPSRSPEEAQPHPPTAAPFGRAAARPGREQLQSGASTSSFATCAQPAASVPLRRSQPSTAFIGRISSFVGQWQQPFDLLLPVNVFLFCLPSSFLVD